MARSRDKSSHWTDKVINNEYHCIHHIPPGSEAGRGGDRGDPHFQCFHNPRTANAPERVHVNPRDYVTLEDEIVPLTARLAFLNEFAPMVMPPRSIPLDPRMYSLNFPRHIHQMGNFQPILAGDVTETPLRNFSVTFHRQEITCVCCPPRTYPLFSIIVNFIERTVSVQPN